MVRPFLFMGFACLVLALPAGVSAQKGGGKGGGSQCQKGQPPQQSSSVQSPPNVPVVVVLNPNTVTAIHEGFAMLKVIVLQLQKQQINNPLVQALAVDLKMGIQVSQSNTLNNKQKEALLLKLMSKSQTELQALAGDSSLSANDRTDLAEAASQFQQVTYAAQRGRPLATLTRNSQD